MTTLAHARRWMLALLLATGASFTASIAMAVELAVDPTKPEALPEGVKLVKIEAFPPSIELTDPFGYSQLLLIGHLDSGESVDVTRMAKLIGEPTIAAVSDGRLVTPVKEGAESLTFQMGEHSVNVPVKVAGIDEPRPVSFIRDVNPAMGKLGCNSGTCHGSQQGKNGFQLSLRGYDPIYDHRSLTDDLESRRFNRSAPDQSLMLLKPSGGVPHVGGVLTKPGERYYELLRQWIADGAKLDLESPRVTSIELFPKDPQIKLPGMKQQMAVYAIYSDGSKRDVTADAFIESSLAEIVEPDKSGLITAVRRGEAAILARYEGAYAATTVVVMGDRTGFEWVAPPENNFIDELVYKKLKEVKILPSDICTDAEFIRRVYLDLTGLPPRPEEVKEFLADTRDTKVKRDELVDRLVGSEEFVEHWTNKWADLLQVNAKFLGEEGAWTFRNWIRQAVATNMPYDKFVYDILSASGSTLENPPASYYKVLREPGETMENTTQLFLAVRFNCNKCHDHPFERWTQDQYYELAAYFARVGRKESPEAQGRKVGGTSVEQPTPLVEIVYDTDEGEITHERTGQVTPPSFPYEHPDVPSEEASRREQLAKWVTSPQNQYFAKSYVNRIWSYLLGVGIIEPVDDIRAGNPPTNPELLDRLTETFIDSGFNVQELMRLICKSRVYQHSIETNEWNADDTINYSHALARRLPAETLYDSLYQAVGAERRLPGVPRGFRASQLPDASAQLEDGFLSLFGRPPRESACECERSSGVMLGQMLNLVNGPTLAQAIADPNNRITKLVENETDDIKLVEELFYSILSRPPSEKELEAGLIALKEAADAQAQRVAALEEFERNELPKRQAEWEKKQAAERWRPLEFTSLASKGGATLTAQADGAVLASGEAPESDIYTLVAKAPEGPITGIRLEAIADPSLPASGPGRAVNGNFVLHELTISVGPADDPSQAKPITLKSAVADFSQDSWGVAGVVDGVPTSGWAIAPQFGKTHTAVFTTGEPLTVEPGSVITITLDQHFGSQHVLGKFRVSVTSAAKPSLQSIPYAIAQILAKPAEERSADEQSKLAEHYRNQDAEWVRLSNEVKNNSVSPRLLGAQDLAWALLNSPAFLFNR